MAKQTAKEFTERLDAFTKFADFLAKSSALPKELKDPGQVIMILQAANDLNMTPTEAFQSLAMINGRISMRGAKVIQRLYTNGYTLKFEEDFTSTEKQFKDKDGKIYSKPVQTGYCTAHIQKGDSIVGSEKYTMEDAKTAGLLGKDNRVKYPKLMLRYRAVRLAITFRAPEVLGGIQVAEEMLDTLADKGYEKLTDDSVVDGFGVEGEVADTVATGGNGLDDVNTVAIDSHVDQELKVGKSLGAGDIRIVEIDATAPHNIKEGSKVVHKLIGKGIVEDIDSEYALVKFESGGLKKMRLDLLSLVV